MALTIAAGCAVDYSGAALLRTRLQSATDMTVLVASKSAPTLSDVDLRALATTVLQNRMNDPNTTVDTLTVSDGRQRIEITT